MARRPASDPTGNTIDVLASGAVQASAYVQSMNEIDGPGVCGLERPLRVSGLSGGRGTLSRRAESTSPSRLIVPDYPD